MSNGDSTVIVCADTAVCVAASAKAAKGAMLRIVVLHVETVPYRMAKS